MTRINNLPSRKATSIAGLTYILVILIGVLKVNIIEPAVMIAGDTDMGSILTNVQLFRVGIVCEILMYLLVVVLSVALYIIVKPINKDFALFALFFRFGEAMVGIITVILSALIPFLILNNEFTFDKTKMFALVESFLNVRMAGLNIVLIFIGVGGTIYCYLFYRSWFVPRILASWGILTYVFMFMLGFVNILLPNRPDVIETFLFSFGGVFEVIFGFWLLIKGVDIEKWESLANQSFD